MTDYNLGRVVGTDGVGIQSIITPLEADGRRRVEITLTDGTVQRFYIEKGTKGDTGTGIRTIELISTIGKDKNYRITFTDNSTFNYTISDGEDAVCDTELDIESENAVQNKVITGTINTINTAIDEKYDKNDVLQLLIDYGLVRTADTANSVVLAGDKEILSYTDGDILTLSATVYDEDNNVVPNKKVVFYKNEVVLDTRYTDANGVATYEYTSEGAGDLRFEASVGSLLSETYSIIDAYRYDANDYTSTITSPISLPNGNFEVSFKIKPSARSSSYSNINIGVDNDNRVMCGQAGSNGELYLQIKKNGNTLISQFTSTVAPLNTDTFVKYSYVDGLHTFTGLNNETITYADSTLDLSEIFKVDINNNHFKELLVKTL